MLSLHQNVTDAGDSARRSRFHAIERGPAAGDYPVFTGASNEPIYRKLRHRFLWPVPFRVETPSTKR
jgi:hypothetical protein